VQLAGLRSRSDSQLEGIFSLLAAGLLALAYRRITMADDKRACDAAVRFA
jgi:hypothetical protein